MAFPRGVRAWVVGVVAPREERRAAAAYGVLCCDVGCVEWVGGCACTYLHG